MSPDVIDATLRDSYKQITMSAEPVFQELPKNRDLNTESQLIFEKTVSVIAH